MKLQENKKQAVACPQNPTACTISYFIGAESGT